MSANHLNTLTAASVIKILELEKHPEGGWFRETFRDTSVSPATKRPTSTMIYYLLESGDFSHIHRLDAAEGWHFYAGHAINVVEIGVSGPKVTRLGLDLAKGERPQHLVERDTWFGSVLADVGSTRAGSWALLGCTVAPGFEFATFELANPTALVEEYPRCESWIMALTR